MISLHLPIVFHRNWRFDDEDDGDDGDDGTLASYLICINILAFYEIGMVGDGLPHPEKYVLYNTMGRLS